MLTVSISMSVVWSHATSFNWPLIFGFGRSTFKVSENTTNLEEKLKRSPLFVLVQMAPPLDAVKLVRRPDSKIDGVAFKCS
jgi:hypothetical protein